MYGSSRRVAHGSIRTEDGRVEHDTITCAHCNGIYAVPHSYEEVAGTIAAGFCMQCYDAVCPSCAGKGCAPFEKKLAEWESRDRFLRSVSE